MKVKEGSKERERESSDCKTCTFDTFVIVKREEIGIKGEREKEDRKREI